MRSKKEGRENGEEKEIWKRRVKELSELIRKERLRGKTREHDGIGKRREKGRGRKRESGGNRKDETRR